MTRPARPEVAHVAVSVTGRLVPEWDRCEQCRVQLYTDPDIPAGRLGHLVPRLAPGQITCPRATTAGGGHQLDLVVARSLLGPRCDGADRIDGPDRPAIRCRHRPRTRAAWHVPALRGGGETELVARQGCPKHLPGLLDELDSHPAAQVSGARLELSEVHLQLSTRDRAHHRPGTWTTHTVTGHVQQNLF